MSQGSQKARAQVYSALSAKRSRPSKKRKVVAKPTRVSVGRQPFPMQLVNTLKYVEQVTLTVTTGFGKYVLSCNGMFDPNITGTGHQPLYFDTCADIYDHYTVLRSRAKFTFAPTVQTTPMLCTVYIDDDTTTKTDATQALEMPGALGSLAIPGGSKNSAVLRPSWDAVKTFGPNPMANDNLQGTSAANPTEQSYYVCHVYDAAGGTSQVQLLVEIEYDAIWDEYKTIAQS